MDCEKGQDDVWEGSQLGVMATVEELAPTVAAHGQWTSLSHSIPITPEQRLVESRFDEQETVLYLGYGSNLAAETFLGKRGIRPLSQVNIVAPAIQLTFDLPGIPYSEPCFANSKYRPRAGDPPEPEKPPYHKNDWKKGLVGVVYEVTKKDYAHIIATEGGGSGYHDVLVDCYVLKSSDLEVPEKPSGTPFKAHTLYAHSAERLRPDPDYAQPSARYLKLITDGAREHELPEEYRIFLENIRTYHTTTSKQMIGRFVFMAVWGPFFAFLFLGAAKLFLRKDGTFPPWFARLTAAFFTAVWASYDHWFCPIFGEGERTIEDKVPAEAETLRDTIHYTKLGKPGESEVCEKTRLLSPK